MFVQAKRVSSIAIPDFVLHNRRMADHDHTDPPSDPALRVKAQVSLFVER
jgi:hypothetical protein